MENKKKRLNEIFIIFLVLVCVVLILISLAELVSIEINGLKSEVKQENNFTSTPFVRPTLPADYTPEPIIDA
jgi:hypothetical protein